MTIQTISATRHTVEQVHEILARDGVVVLTDLVPMSVIDQVDAELAPYLDRTPFGEGQFFGRRTRRTASIFAKSKASHQLGAHPYVTEVVKSFLLKHCSSIQISGTQAISIHPGEPEQVLHADEELWPIERGRMEYQINTIWALTDFTEQNGATRIIPGSHKVQEIERLPDPSKVVAAEMKRGSLVIWLGSTVHGGGHNRSDAPRTGLSLAYCLGWMRQAENQYLANPVELARTYPRELQNLLGYEVHEPNLGCFEGQSPRILLETEERPDVLAFKDYLPGWAAEQVAQYYQMREAANAA